MFNSKDESDLYIAMVYDTTKKVLSEMNEQSISEYISRQMYADGGISKHINGYTKDAPVKITTVSDTQVNGMKMKKYEGTITLAKSSVDKETTWDCYIYGYAFETTTTTIMYLGLEQEQSQTADKIELIKKNMDAIVETIELF